MLRWALVLWPVTGQLINHVVAVHLVVGQPQRGPGDLLLDWLTSPTHTLPGVHTASEGRTTYNNAGSNSIIHFSHDAPCRPSTYCTKLC
jgi:hypothetical protein